MRCLNTLDLSQDFSYILSIRSGGEIPNLLWKMQQLRHLYLPWRYKIIHAEKLRLDTLTNLEILRYIDPKQMLCRRSCQIEKSSQIAYSCYKKHWTIGGNLQSPEPRLTEDSFLVITFLQWEDWGRYFKATALGLSSWSL